MQFFKLISSSVHGEKEFVWLGQEFMGDSYKFNSHPAISIGELTQRNAFQAKELCSTHPGHLGDDGSLLWFNSGFLTCKKPDSFFKDINFERNEDKTLPQLKKEYRSPLHITNGLIPPPGEYSLASDEHPEEPSRGWVMTEQCENYLWCAYDMIGGGENPSIPKGEIINFKSTDSEKWDYYGQVWVSYFNLGKGGKLDSGIVEDDAFDELGLADKDDEEEESGSSLKSFMKGGFAKNSGDFTGKGRTGSGSGSDSKAASGNTDSSSGSKSGSLRIKKPSKGGKIKGSASDYEEYEGKGSSSSSKFDSSSGSKKGKGKFSVDADFIDDSDASSGKSKGFKETDDDLDSGLSFDQFPDAPSSSNSKAAKDDEKNSLSSWWGALTGSKKDSWNSFASDSKIDIDDLVGEDGVHEVATDDVLGKELLDSMNKPALSDEEKNAQAQKLAESANSGDAEDLSDHDEAEASRLQESAEKAANPEDERAKDKDGDGRIDEESTV
ncbi:unnamed protein product [Ambrosiozyma monospora]|uniref:Unnamed protein product n=1 Tax=Ambrosiozyma monospora TaxID=43982 RepID=A0A9W6Z1U8_AMBMO|nr:unnamed protein product [Ambrosiozyma monospora]